MTAPLTLTHPLPARAPAPQPADIEWLAQYALSRTGNLPWACDRDKELAFDRGLTVKPKKRQMISWTLAEACAGLRVGKDRPLPAKLDPGPDAEKIIAAIKRLDPKTASLVIGCARTKIRPDWTVNGVIEPSQTPKWVYPKKRNRKKGHTKTLKMVWDVDPGAIRAAREVYERWHEGMLRLWVMLDGELSGFAINGLAAPAWPWKIDIKKIA